jgi:MGT family glycosyltransferase
VLPLCAELKRRGFRVTCPTTKYFSKKFAATGAEPVIFYSDGISQEWKKAIDYSFQLPSDDPNWWITAANFFPEFLRTTVSDVIPQLEQFYKQNRPDLIVYDRFALTGRIIAKQLHCSKVQFSPHFAYYKKKFTRENGICRTPEPMLEAGRYLDAFMTSHGILGSDNLYHTEELNLFFVPKAFQHNGDAFGNEYCFVGALIPQSAPPSASDVGYARPTILISDLSGLPGVWVHSNNYFKTCIDALADSGYHCVLSLGDVSFQQLCTLPGNFEINDGRSHIEILKCAALSICHGGLGSTLEAIYNGVPVLAIPINPETEEVAYRLTELGLGRKLERRFLTVDQIRGSVDTMLRDPLLLERVKSAQEEFRHCGGVELAANKIIESIPDQ